MNEREMIAARVLIEERWSAIGAAAGIPPARRSDLAALPVSEGGLGRRIHHATLSSRATAYAERQRQRIEDARQDELDLRRVEAELALDEADRRLGQAVSGEDYERAARRYDRAEAHLLALKSDDARVPLTRAIRRAVEIDIALELDAILPDDQRADLRRSLLLEAPLAAFARRLGACALDSVPEALA